MGRLSRQFDLTEIARSEVARLQRRLQREEGRLQDEELAGGTRQEAARDLLRRQEEDRLRKEEFAVVAARELAVDISRDLGEEERREAALAEQLQGHAG